MNSDAKTLVILTPGFPENESDSTCIPPQQIFVKALKKNYPFLNIIVLAFQYPFESKKYLWHGINIISFNGRNRGKFYRVKVWRNVWKTLNKIKKERQITGILSFWLGECALIAKYYARQNRIQHYSWILGQDARKGNRYFPFIKPRPGELIALSDFIAKEFYKNYRQKPQHIIPVGIDASMFETQTNNRDIDILGAGSLIPLKQYDLFIEVVRTLANDLPWIRAVICGDGNDKKKLQVLISDLHMDDKINLAGEVPHSEVIHLMQRAKVFLHTSSFEGFGAVCSEALYAGCQVISFCKPMTENIKHWHIVNSKEEMVKKALEILNDRNTQYTPVLFYPVEYTTASVMDLFRN